MRLSMFEHLSHNIYLSWLPIGFTIKKKKGTHLNIRNNPKKQ